MKKSFVIACAAFCLVIAAVAVSTYFQSPASAQRNANVRIEYAVINGRYLPYPPDSASVVSAAVNICYLQATGCQNEEIRTEVNMSKFIQDERLENSGRVKSLAVERATQIAFSRAISKLGSEGWELVTAPPIEFDIYYTNPQGITSVKEGSNKDGQHSWFKRTR